MKITDHTTRLSRTDTLAIEDGEVRPVPYSRSGKTYRVDHVSLTWFDNGDGWRADRPTLRGQVLKKDGTDSLNRTDEKIWASSERPEWLTDLIAEIVSEVTQ